MAVDWDGYIESAEECLSFARTMADPEAPNHLAGDGGGMDEAGERP
jgi:hypothetical protein